MKHLRKGKHIYRMEHVQVANFDGSLLYVECFRLAGIGREFVVRAVFHWDNTLTTGDYTEDKYPFSASDILAELEADGKLIRPGKVPIVYFKQRFGF